MGHRSRKISFSVRSGKQNIKREEEGVEGQKEGQGA